MAALQFAAALTGLQEVPPVSTISTGSSRVAFNPTLTAVNVLLTVNLIRDVTEAHIHLGRPGENGPIVLFLFGPTDVHPTFGRDALLVNGTFTAANLTGPLAGMPLSVLAEQMAAGNTYANVHTVFHPGGEIRGQLVTILL